MAVVTSVVSIQKAESVTLCTGCSSLLPLVEPISKLPPGMYASTMPSTAETCVAPACSAGVAVAVGWGVFVTVLVAVGWGVLVAVGSGVAVGVVVGVAASVAVSVDVCVGVGVAVKVAPIAPGPHAR
jgi:hypothetical protein